MPIAEFKVRMDEVVDQVHRSARATGSDRIYVPGEIEHEKARPRREHGIPLEEPLVHQLNDLAGAVGGPTLG